MRALTRKKLFAIAAGVALAATPLLAFDYWLSDLIETQDRQDVDTSASRALTLAEARVQQVITTLDHLAARGVNGCRPHHVEALRYAAFGTVPVKEVAIVAADGQTQCSHLGLPRGDRKVLASEPLADVKNYSIDLIDVGNNQHMVRLRRPTGAGPNGVAALVPVILFLPQVSTRGNLFNAYASISTRGGIVIGQTGTPPNRDDGLAYFSKMRSEKFGFNVEVARLRGQVTGGYAALHKFRTLASLALALALIGFAALIPRRQTYNPVAEIESALEAGEFVPYYQPIVDIRSGQLRGAEVLVRWRKPDGSLVLPGAFIPLAESSGLILEMTRDLMRRVSAEAGAAIGQRPALKISFNFAGKLLCDESIVKDVRNIFSGSPIRFSQVVIEVTERDPIDNLSETRKVIAALQALGVRIAIDDVGTGHSGLSYMLKLGVDIIKIDKMFVDAIGTDRNSTTIVETLVDLAHNMRMDVVAEGVENFEQVVHLRELGIRSAQGYVFAPPLPGSAFLQLVEAIDPLPASEESRDLAGAAHRYMSARNRFEAA